MANRFKDIAAREWAVDINVHAVEQVAARTEVRLEGLLKNQLAGLLELNTDPVKFVRVLWVLVEDQAVKLGVTPEQLGRSLGGDALEAAFEAFVGALADFSPSRLRPAIRALTAKTIPDAAPSPNPISSACATNSPASSESIPPG